MSLTDEIQRPVTDWIDEAEPNDVLHFVVSRRQTHDSQYGKFDTLAGTTVGGDSTLKGATIRDGAKANLSCARADLRSFVEDYPELEEGWEVSVRFFGPRGKGYCYGGVAQVHAIQETLAEPKAPIEETPALDDSDDMGEGG